MKTIFQSKTVLFNLMLGLAAMWPPAVTWLTAHPEEALALLASCNLILRMVTKDKLVLFCYAIISLLILPACVSMESPNVSLKWQTKDNVEFGVQFTKILRDAKQPIATSTK